MTLAVGAFFMVGIAVFLIWTREKYNGRDYGTLVTAGMCGLLACLLSLIVERTVYAVSSPDVFVDAFFVVAATEEGWKYFLLYYFIFRKKTEKRAYDYLKSSLVASLIFAGVENLLYVTTYFPSEGLEIALTRMSSAIPMHCVCGISLGAWKARCRSSVTFLGAVVPFFTPWVMHGAYDFFALQNNNLYYVVLLLGIVFHWKSVKSCFL